MSKLQMLSQGKFLLRYNFSVMAPENREGTNVFASHTLATQF